MPTPRLSWGLALVACCGCGKRYWGLKAAKPQVVSVSVADLPVWSDRGRLLQCEAGLGGGKVSIGYFSGYLVEGAWIFGAHAGKVSVLRTWHDPYDAEPNRTFVGLEYEAVFIDINSYAGVFWPVDGGKAALFGGIGIGF